MILLFLFDYYEYQYTIPEEYNNLPKLIGRAKVLLSVKSNSGGFRLNDDKTTVQSTDFIIELDGYHAPLTSGNILDLIDKGFYNNINIPKAEELIVQFGQPKGSIDGYIDPKTGNIRTIPLELFYKQDTQPVYGITSDDDKRATETMALPFQAFGAVGMARNNEDPDTGDHIITSLQLSH